MALDVALTTVTFTSGSVADVESADLGFTPKALIFLGMRATGVGSFTNEQGFSIGATTGATQNAAAGVAVSDARTSDERSVSQVRNDACYAVMSGTGIGPDGRVALKSFTRSVSGTGQGFTLQVNQAFGGSWVVDVLALGGSDIQNAFAGTFQVTSGAGAKAITTPGFQGNCLLLFGTGNRQSTINASSSGYGNLSIGAAVSAASRFCTAIGSAGGVTTTNHAAIMSTNAIARLIGSSMILESTLDFTSHDASGFTVTLSGSDVVRTPHVGFLYLKLAQAPEIGTFQTQTATGQFDGATALSKVPKALLAFCRPEATATETALVTGVDAMELAAGMATASAKRALWFEGYEVGAVGAGNPTETYARRATDRFLLNYARSVANTLAADGEVDFVSFTPSAGTGFRLDQVDADVQQTLVPFLAFAEAAAGSAVPVIQGSAHTRGMF